MRRLAMVAVVAALIGAASAWGAGAVKDAAFGVVTAQQVKAQIIETDGADGAAVVATNSQDYVQLFYAPGFFVNVSAGSDDPTAAPCKPARTGSLYLRHDNDAAGETWAKTGGDNCAWTRIA